MILVIGYGNPLRRDDSIGGRIAEWAGEKLKDEPVQVQTAYQLTPELVEPIRHADLVVFLDARVGDTPGALIQETVKPEVSTGAFSHHVSPGTLLGAAQDLYGVSPKGILISIVGADFDLGSELSPELNALLPVLAQQVEATIRLNAHVEQVKEQHHA